MVVVVLELPLLSEEVESELPDVLPEALLLLSLLGADEGLGAVVEGAEGATTTTGGGVVTFTEVGGGGGAEDTGAAGVAGAGEDIPPDGRTIGADGGTGADVSDERAGTMTVELDGAGRLK